ncbi:asparagine synthase (glutamine-hydrolyzing) [Allocatelliglobosispora scoriae]|uniref:asparagine synthase (glutamine-hydrolyzing) n=1 Tax=Allocatelliglobosispora scoriae TaxID=643052 RepID=A0A841BTP2_9ACTN|nr:asparagine synthase (glutamine-hydrolyzing) [Allocatelliglobosispora scoriae]MBB5870808.1 asparagine synthase (glutamine-hydrolyzing) [Allocatelliglobosispora scoriae]
MCGIAGIVGTAEPDQDALRRMCDAIIHRGPDGEGAHLGRHAALGMRRLAIVDVAGGDQPVYNEDRTVVAVFNGELYNHPELRAELLAKGHTLRGSGDSECLVHLYEEYGDELVHRLRGMFAFAIWDARRDRLLLARDRVGKKPLYWSETGGRLRFASELKSLLATGDPAALDLTALHHYLTYQYVPAPWSILDGIAKLPPGHILTWENGVTATRRYWRLDSTPVTGLRLPEAEERLRELLLDAVRVRMISERPVGAFLSGGVDSAAVVAAMTRVSAGPVRTFCVGFTDARYDESGAARSIARHLGTEHHELIVDAADIEAIGLLTRHFDEPFADSSALPSLRVAQLTGEHVTVALTGDGGDESFGGYERYRLMALGTRVPTGLARGLGMGRLGAEIVARTRPLSRRRAAGRALELLAQPLGRRYAHLMSHFTPQQKDALYTDDVRASLAGDDSYRLLDEAFAASRATADINRMMDVDVNTYLPGDLLAKVDITTMAYSLEARSPLLDHRLMEWAAGLPSSWKVRGGTTKWLLRRAVAPWLPADHIRRPKRGFGVPMAQWLRTDLRDLSRDLLTDETAVGRGLFRPEVVRLLLAEHAEGQDHATRLWSLMQFELWARTWLDRSPVGVPSTAASRQWRG